VHAKSTGGNHISKSITQIQNIHEQQYGNNMAKTPNMIKNEQMDAQNAPAGSRPLTGSAGAQQQQKFLPSAFQNEQNRPSIQQQISKNRQIVSAKSANQTRENSMNRAAKST
jgi:hypothetical protein|tara:strand:- start:1639 stop:1974 length:336 start_codon:yes stop_codon:yes gene_type:complete